MAFHKSEYEQPYHGLVPNEDIRPGQLVPKVKTLNAADKSIDEMMAGAAADSSTSLNANVGYENEVLGGGEAGGVEDLGTDHPVIM